MSKLKPNFTQIPNWFLDELLHELSGSECRVLLYIMRRTYGFQKDSDAISISQICGGIKTRDGKVLDNGTGLKNRTVMNALKSLEDKDIIFIDRRQGLTNFYKLDTSVKKCTSAKNDSGPVSKNAQDQCQKVHTQKKEEIKIQKKDATALQVDVLITSFKDINPIYKTWYPNKTQRKACELLLEMMDFDKLKILIEKVLPISNRRQYAPTITTPHQLHQKFAQLQSYLVKEKDKQTNQFKVLL